MDGYSPSLTELWKEWNVRVTVLLSFTLQVVLMVLGDRRKYDSRLWVRIVTWCAYLSADWIATYALGIITNNISHLNEKNCGHTGANSELIAFWAPFLLMHLGGPDTITAYSLEDNELWLRHFLGLVVQMVMAVYVCVMAWTGSLLSYLSLLMLFAGLIKYGERTWVLRKARVEEIRDSFADLNLTHLEQNLSRAEFKNSLGHILFAAYFLMDISFQPLLLDIDVIWDLEGILHQSFRSSVEDAFKIIEMSLAYMYNNIYTKALLLYTHVGVGLRVVTVILVTSSVSVLFPVLIHKHKFSKIDVTVTFILLFGAIILEIYSTLLLLFSDRFQVWLIQHPKWSMFEAFKGVLPKKKRRWSNKMSQLSLLSFIMKEKPLPCPNFLKHFSIVQSLEMQWYATDIEVSDDLKKLILTYLKTERVQDRNATSERLSIDVSDMDFTKELEKSILAWHVATEKWYEMDREHVNGKGHVIELTCQISRYMFSLLLLLPDMVSNANTTKFTLQAILVAARGSSFASRIAACQNLDELLERTVSEIEDPSKNLAGVNESILNFYKLDLPEFLQQLEEKHWQERWTIISCTWLEMLAYAANKCRGMQHAQRLKCGGEFLTHIWLLTKVLSLIEDDFTSHVPSWARSIINFGDVSSRRLHHIRRQSQFSILHKGVFSQEAISDKTIF